MKYKRRGQRRHNESMSDSMSTKQKESDKKNNVYSVKRILVASIGILLGIVCIVVFYYLTGLNQDKISKVTEFNTDWTINSGNNSYSGVDITQFHFRGMVHEGQPVVLYNKIPKNWDYENPVLRIQTHTSAVIVYVNGKEVYSYGESRYLDNKMVGSGYQFIDLADTYKGKSIKIVILPTEDNAFAAFDSILITSHSNVYGQLMTEYRVSFTVAVFLVIFGVCLIVVGFILYMFTPQLLRLVRIGILALCVGIWTLCTYRLVQLFAIPLYYLTILQYMSVYSGLLSLVVYFEYYVKEINNKKIAIMYYSLLAIQGIGLFLRIVLHMTNICYISRGRGTIYLFFFLTFIFMACLVKELLSSGYRQAKLLGVGLFFLLGVIIFESVNTWMYLYQGHYLTSFSGVAAFATILFLMFLLVEFGTDIAIKLKAATEQEVLYRMAYTDELTGLYNRRFCEDKMENMTELNEAYMVINLDLNNLKTTNDTLGHEVGDRLISSFANVIKKVFQDSGIGIVGRMGGDEFIVLITKCKGFSIDAILEQMQKEIDQVNQSQNEFVMSTAYGYARSTEVEQSENSPHAKLVYSLADNRMYEYKRRYKEEQGLPNRS